MSVTTDRIVWGETYDLQLSATDADGDAITLDGTYSAKYRFTRDKVGGEIVETGDMTIAAGVATASIDTGASEWCPGVHYYDIRLTDASGNDFWTTPALLILENRNSPSST